jgi:DNA-binding response OmpR family regulator
MGIEVKGTASVAAVKTKSVVIVEDDPDLCDLLSTVIRAFGYKVDRIAHDGDEIVDAFTKEKIHPDLILMDYRMPRMNGLDAAKAIRQSNPQTKIVIVTSFDNLTKKAASQGLGLLQKPFSLSELRQVVEENMKE